MSSTEDELHLIQDADVKEEMVIRKWKHRRRMAYVSLLAMIAMTIALMFFVDIDRLEKIKDASTWAYIMFGSIVGSYLGAATWDGKK